MNIRKVFGHLCLPVLVLGTLLSSCTEELSSEVVPGGGGGAAGEQMVTLKLQVPGAAASKTRAISDDAERTVHDLYILAFKVDPDTQVETFGYYTVARKGGEDTDAGESTWTASLRPADYDQTFVMVANAQDTPGNVDEQITQLTEGTEKETVVEALKDWLDDNEKTGGFRVDGDKQSEHHPLTMYGQTDNIKIERNKETNLDVALHRIVARVQVKFDVEAALFKAETVFLCNFNDKAQVLPNGLTKTEGEGADGWMKAVSIPTDATKLPESFTNENNIPSYGVREYTAADNTTKFDGVMNEIYLFETEQPTDGTDTEKHLKRPCLVVKGTYDGSHEGYYRVDFATQDATTGDVNYYDIIRNHSYAITVTGVSGKGCTSLNEAMAEKASNITASVIKWDDNTIGNIEFEGDRVLGLSTTNYKLLKPGGVQKLQVRATKNVTWTANIYNANADGSADVNGARPTWIQFVQDGNGVGTTLRDSVGTDALQDVYFKVERNDERPERKAIIRLTDEKGRLSVEALVVQNQEEIPVQLDFTVDGEPVSEIGFDHDVLLTRTVAIKCGGPNDVTLSWEITVDEGDKGIQMKEVDVNGTPYLPLKELKGEIEYNATDNTATMQISVEAFSTTEAYGTRRGKLILIATSRSTGETQVLDIPLVQKKYGLKVNKTEVLCGGQEVLIYVKGNYEWQVEIGGDGYNHAYNENLVWQFDDFQKGTPSENNYVKESVVRISTKATPKIAQSTDPNYYKGTLSFKRKGTEEIHFSTDITFKPGILAIEESKNNYKLYEVYREEGITIEDKNKGGNPPVPGAKIMTYEQGCALSRETEEYEVGNFSWEICNESALRHEHVVSQGGKDINAGLWSTPFEALVLAASRDANIDERISISHSKGSAYSQLERRLIMNIVNYAAAARHDYFNVVVEGKTNSQATYTVSAIGYLSADKDGKTIFKTLVDNPTWINTSGDPDNLPIGMYGNAYRCTLKPKFNFNGDKENYRMEIGRQGILSPLSEDDYKERKFPTYYFKETQETSID